MKFFLPNTYSALTTTILTATLSLSQIANANESSYEYNPASDSKYGIKSVL